MRSSDTPKNYFLKIVKAFYKKKKSGMLSKKLIR